MTSRLRGVVFLLLGVAVALTPVSAQSDAAPLVAAARQALGGAAALDAITSLSLNGSSVRRSANVSISSSFEISYLLPDKFLKVSRRSFGGMMNFDITDYEGFNGDHPIKDTVAPNAPMPVVLPAGPPPTTPEAIEEARVKRLAIARATFVEAMLPLFVKLPAAYGLNVDAGGKVMLDKTEMDAIDIRRADGKTWRLLLDPSTHLPAAITWKAKPIVTFSTSTTSTSRVAVGPGGIVRPADQPPPPNQTQPMLPSGDPTAGLPDADWVMMIRDYKVADGFNWPRRFTSSWNGNQWQDVRVSRYRINPKIDARIFEPGKK